MRIEYIVELLTEEHPLYGDFRYSVRKIIDARYTGEGRFCRDLEDVTAYLRDEERKR